MNDEQLERIRWIYARLEELKALRFTPQWGYNYSQEAYHLERELMVKGYRP